jgi:hypothetical protein
MARGRSATATLNEEELATVTDWSQVHEFIRSQNAFFLLQRRINSAAGGRLPPSAENRFLAPPYSRSVPSPFAASKETTMPAIAAAQRQAIAEYRQQLRQELAVLHTRIAPPAGNRIAQGTCVHDARRLRPIPARSPP